MDSQGSDGPEGTFAEEEKHQHGEGTLVPESFLNDNQRQEITQFRHELRLHDDKDKRGLCITKRTALLRQHAGLETLIAAYDTVFDEFGTSDEALRENTDEEGGEWRRIVDKEKKRLSALNATAKLWGQDVVRYYKWGAKNLKFCEVLRAAANRVPGWSAARKEANIHIYERNNAVRDEKFDPEFPITQSILAKFRRDRSRTPLQDRSRFGYDCHGILVPLQYAVPQVATRSSETACVEALAELHQPTSLFDGGPSRRQTTDAVLEEQSQSPLVEDQTEEDCLEEECSDSQDEDHPNPEDGLSHKTDPLGGTKTSQRALRPRINKTSYHETASGTGKGKSASQPRQINTKTLLTRRCCPDVPDPYLALLDEPSRVTLDLVERISSLHLCHLHLQKFKNALCVLVVAAMRDVRPAADEETSSTTSTSATSGFSSEANLSSPGPTQKKRRVDYDVSGRQGRDLSYCRTMLDELKAKLWKEEQEGKPETHGYYGNKLVYDTLLKSERSNADGSLGALEVQFLTGPEAKVAVETGAVEVPIVASNQQTFEWDDTVNPIAELLDRLGSDECSVSVQIPTRNRSLRSFSKQTLGQVRKRFKVNTPRDDPWNILDLRSPLPPAILPRFLMGRNCGLLSAIRTAVLDGGSAERPTATTEEWNAWRDFLEWVLLAEGGHVTAPHIDGHGFGTWITVQKGRLGFGYLCKPNREERQKFMADPENFTSTKWRYVVVDPGETIFFDSGTPHFVFRVSEEQTLALGGHVLLWSRIVHWITVVLDQKAYPHATNEEMEDVGEYVKVVKDLVADKVQHGWTKELFGGEEGVTQFFKLAEEFT